MLITLMDDGVLRIYSSPDEASRDVEALDAEESFRAIFDEHAQPYSISWLRPNRKSRLFGLIEVVENGEYTLIPHGTPNPGELLRIIRTTRIIEPESATPKIRELERQLADRG